VLSVPLPKDHVARIGELERLAAACGADVAARPTAEAIAREALRDELLKAPRDGYADVMDKAGSDAVGPIAQILREAAAGTLKPKLAKWRQKALEAWADKRQPQSHPPRRTEKAKAKKKKKPEKKAAEDGEGGGKKAAGKCRICGGTGGQWRDRKRTLCHKCDFQAEYNAIMAISREYCLNAIAVCHVPAIFEACLDNGVKDEWRREAIAKRLEHLASIGYGQESGAEDAEKQAAIDAINPCSAKPLRRAKHESGSFFCTRDCHGCSIGCAVPGDRHNRMRFAIFGGRRAEGVPAIERCADLQFLQEAEARGLTGDWRRAAVAKRIRALKCEACGREVCDGGDTCPEDGEGEA